MTILCDVDLIAMLNKGLLIKEPNLQHVNPASIDICIGRTAMVEVSHGRFEKQEIPKTGLKLEPNDFVLVDTWEDFNVPNGYAMDLRLKSTTARKGYNHSLAFWVDPGWQGFLTMEIKNLLQFNSLPLIPGQRFAQVVVYKLSGESAKPYNGRYQGASEVEAPKREK